MTRCASQGLLAQAGGGAAAIDNGNGNPFVAGGGAGGAGGGHLTLSANSIVVSGQLSANG